jgi:hypothetical protein
MIVHPACQRNARLAYRMIDRRDGLMACRWRFAKRRDGGRPRRLLRVLCALRVSEPVRCERRTGLHCGLRLYDLLVLCQMAYVLSH